MVSVCHLSSAHTRYDVRIYMKECRSLAMAGYAVFFVVADGQGDEIKEGVSIRDVGVSKGRLSRMLKTTKNVFNQAKHLDADVYHLHDPELIPVGLKLRKLGKTVIFDAHEDFPKQLLTKPYLNKFVAFLLSNFFSIYERWAFKRFNALVAATPSIQRSLSKVNGNVVEINNYPLLGELNADSVSWNLKKGAVCYVGAVSSIRGIKQLVSAMALVKSTTRLQIAGKFSEREIRKQVVEHEAWRLCDDHGLVNREGVREILSRSFAGIVTFLPVANHLDSQPNKMFEYMSAGVPVIASHFPLWRDIISGNNCGICVDPEDPQAIANAIDLLSNDHVLAKEMGCNGQRAVLERYNWSIEETKLIALYTKLTGVESRL